MEINLLHPQAFEKREQLDWPVFSKKSIEYCFFTQNHSYFETPQFFKSIDALEHHYSHVVTITDILLLSNKNLFNSQFLKDISSEHLLRLKKGACLSLNEINSISLLIEQFQHLIQVPSISDIIKNKFSIPSELKDIIKLLKFVRKYVDTKGELITENDKRLSNLIDKIKKNETSVRQSLQRIIALPSLKESLQYAGFDIINDHFVITIKSDHYQTSMGDIIAHSKTGASLYVEPNQIRELSSKILLEKRELDRLIQRICFELSSKLSTYSKEIHTLHLASLYLDKLQAISQVNLYYGLSKPELNHKGSLELINFFHPLIEKPVRNSLIMTDNDHGALISGPNTGGKTICLKVIALSQVLMQSGFFVPADSASLSLFEKIYFLGNDDQAVEMGLSSFSSEIKNYLQVLDEAKEEIENKENNSLIIIDEIFNSTSSEEASSLALGFIEQFTKNKKNKTYISSHHSMLKNSIFESKLLHSFHMGFQNNINLPTYKLIQGSPGSSMALEVFDSLSKNSKYANDIKKVAQSYLNSMHTDYEKLMFELGQQKSHAIKLQQNLKDSQELFNRDKQSFKNALELKKEKEVSNLRDRVSNIKSKVARFKKQYFNSELSQIKGELSDLEQLVKKTDHNQTRIKDHLEPTNNIEIGRKYFSKSLGQTIEVTQVLSDKARAKMGNIKLTVKLNDLYIDKYVTNSIQERMKPKKTNNVFVNIDTHTEYRTDYDCRGMRLSEFQHEIQQALQGLLLKKIPYLKIIHGHGDGTLKSYLRSYLKEDGNYNYEPCSESADGATVIQL